MKVLGIETSADDTGIALIQADGELGSDFRFSVLANEVASQRHAEYGGIYPNLAKNEHIKNLPLLLGKVRNISSDKPDVIAVTAGPGIEPCLWQGITFAHELAVQWHVPVVGANHMEGHILMGMMSGDRLATFEFPALALLISGGHTELILMRKFGAYEYLGRTRDDAVGEAFDKVARMLGLPYPGGPHISRLAAEAREMNFPSDIKLPRPMLNENSYDFSFSGLKTAVLRLTENRQLTDDDKRALAREFEDAAADVLVGKTLRAVEERGANAVVVGGGVSANKYIRAALRERLEAVGCKLLVCPPQFSTDNGLMIALAGYFHARTYEFAELEKLAANGAMKLC
ncbi:MAG: hypothetical protein RLZZ416_619 [Candidatus Parcubacteria bacterium]|jgi:N6-L-threonylcarbamoyladenine synthase